jgi:SPP1 family predicted phage head-tail adaptor
MSNETKNNASLFNKRVTLQSKTSTPNGQGGSTSPVWSNVLTNIPAKISHKISRMGDEKFQQHQLYASHIIIVTIRYRTSINVTESMRLKYKTKEYNIRTVYVPDEAQKTIVIYAEEIQTKGSAL